MYQISTSSTVSDQQISDIKADFVMNVCMDGGNYDNKLGKQLVGELFKPIPYAFPFESTNPIIYKVVKAHMAKVNDGQEINTDIINEFLLK